MGINLRERILAGNNPVAGIAQPLVDEMSDVIRFQNTRIKELETAITEANKMLETILENEAAEGQRTWTP